MDEIWKLGVGRFFLNYNSSLLLLLLLSLLLLGEESIGVDKRLIDSHFFAAIVIVS